MPLELAAGQMLLFSRLIPRGSGANTTDDIRLAYQIGFAPPGHRVAGQPPRPLLRGGLAVGATDRRTG